MSFLNGYVNRFTCLDLGKMNEFGHVNCFTCLDLGKMNEFGYVIVLRAWIWGK
jgi:hypothetical protein